MLGGDAYAAKTQGTQVHSQQSGFISVLFHTPLQNMFRSIFCNFLGMIIWIFQIIFVTLLSVLVHGAAGVL